MFKEYQTIVTKFSAAREEIKVLVRATKKAECPQCREVKRVYVSEYLFRNVEKVFKFDLEKPVCQNCFEFGVIQEITAIMVQQRKGGFAERSEAK